MSYIEKKCCVNWRFRSFVQYMIIMHIVRDALDSPFLFAYCDNNLGNNKQVGVVVFGRHVCNCCKIHILLNKSLARINKK